MDSSDVGLDRWCGAALPTSCCCPPRAPSPPSWPTRYPPPPRSWSSSAPLPPPARTRARGRWLLCEPWGVYRRGREERGGMRTQARTRTAAARRGVRRGHVAAQRKHVHRGLVAGQRQPLAAAGKREAVHERGVGAAPQLLRARRCRWHVTCCMCARCRASAARLCTSAGPTPRQLVMHAARCSAAVSALARCRPCASPHCDPVAPPAPRATPRAPPPRATPARAPAAAAHPRWTTRG